MSSTTGKGITDSDIKEYVTQVLNSGSIRPELGSLGEFGLAKERAEKINSFLQLNNISIERAAQVTGFEPEAAKKFLSIADNYSVDTKSTPIIVSPSESVAPLSFITPANLPTVSWGRDFSIDIKGTGGTPPYKITFGRMDNFVGPIQIETIYPTSSGILSGRIGVTGSPINLPNDSAYIDLILIDSNNKQTTRTFFLNFTQYFLPPEGTRFSNPVPTVSKPVAAAPTAPAGPVPAAPAPITRVSEIVITPPLIPSGQTNKKYEVAILVRGGLPPYTFSIKETTKLPTNLTLDSNTGVISGTPTLAGSFSFIVIVNDSINNISERNYSIKIDTNVSEPPPVLVAPVPQLPVNVLPTTSILSNSINSIITNTLALPNLNNSLITNTVINTISNEISKIIFNSTRTQINTQLNTISNQSIGIFNPLNLVTGTTSSNDIRNILSVDFRNASFLNSINSSILSIITSAINNLFPGTEQLILRNSIINSLNTAITSQTSSFVDTSITGATNEIFNLSTTTTVSPIVADFDNIFVDLPANAETINEETFFAALDNYDSFYETSLVNQSLLESRNFNPINSPDNIEKLKVVTTGFLDPTATYPTKDYEARPDTNKLATGDVKDTIVEKKNSTRMLNAKLPLGDSWQQPESPYRSEYPFNKVTQTESGHVIEIDDTKGSERLHIYHRTGTFVEIDANGNVTKRSTGSDYEIIDRNGYVSIAGKASVSINGACNIYVGNDANIEVDGDTNIVCHNDITGQAGGNVRLSAVDSFNIRAANVFIEADKEMHFKSVENTFLYSKNQHNYVEENSYLTSVNYYGYHSGDLHVQTEIDQHFKAKGNYNLDTGGVVDTNDGAAKNSSKGTISKNSTAGLLEGRKVVSYINLSDPQSLTINDNYSLSVEEPGASEQEIESQKNSIVKRGLVDKKIYEEPSVEQESSSPKSTNSTLILPKNELKTYTELPDNYRISPNFTLGMLSSETAVSKDKIVSQRNLSYGEIVYNLSLVALNICEPVLKLYPNMFVTSGFRLAGKSSPSSVHPLGQAVDLQFKGISKIDYYKIANVLAEKLNYKQLLLEYAASTNNPWVHISIDANTVSRQIMTFNNHKKYSDNLVNLA